jgi:hypothetical protein
MAATVPLAAPLTTPCTAPWTTAPTTPLTTTVITPTYADGLDMDNTMTTATIVTRRQSYFLHHSILGLDEFESVAAVDSFFHAQG